MDASVPHAGNGALSGAPGSGCVIPLTGAARASVVACVLAVHIGAMAALAGLGGVPRSSLGAAADREAARGEVVFEVGSAPVPEQAVTGPSPDAAPASPQAAQDAPPREPPIEPFPLRPDSAETRDALPPPDEADAAKAQKVIAQPEPATAPASAPRIGNLESRDSASPGAMTQYAALVSAEINRHKHYPAPARQRGVQGATIVSFTIGSDGAIDRYAITQSSGSDELDAAARKMMAQARFQPPPRGLFTGSIAIQFRLR